MRDKNLALTERGFELFSKGDFDEIRELFSDDIIWRTAAGVVFEPEYKGIDAVLEYFTMLFELSGGTFKVEPVYMLADDDRSMVMQHVSATHAGKLLDTKLVLVFEIRDDKVYEVTEYASELGKLEAFWS